MLVLQTLRGVLWVLELAMALPIGYLCLVSLSAILVTRTRTKPFLPASPALPHAHFALLIPAHNEIAVLGKLLESVAALSYPKQYYAVFVVADNCTDTTAELARSTGWVQVYERFDHSQRGKGFALNWLMQRLQEDHLSYDAYVILDADSVVSPQFLQALNLALAQGAQALQAQNTVLNVTDSPSTALRWLALTLMNHVRPLGRNGLGCSSTLTGNGMCLSHGLLLRHPWQAFALAEDYQYYLHVVQSGEKVRYVPDAIVRSEMPATFAHMRTQDIRWEAPDTSQPVWKTVWHLLKAGMRNRDKVRIEAVAELLTPPLSSLIGGSLLTLLGALLLWSMPNLVMSLLLIGGLLFYLSTPFYLLHPPRAVMRALWHAPGFMVWKLWVTLVVKRSKKQTTEWIRTSRTTSVK